MQNQLRITSTQSCDVLIIGAGGAGLRCAAEIFGKRPGTRIVAVTKVAHPQKSHTATAQGGLAAVDPSDPVDQPVYHMYDTWKGSDCTADQNVITKIVEAAWDQIVWLENRGMHGLPPGVLTVGDQAILRAQCTAVSLLCRKDGILSDFHVHRVGGFFLVRIIFGFPLFGFSIREVFVQVFSLLGACCFIIPIKLK